MKKALLLMCSMLIINLQAQNPTYKEKLFYTCKVWGFVKYYHSGVSTCQVNWDSVLLSRLPFIKNAVTVNDLNDELDILLTAAGPMAIASGVLPDTIQPVLKRNRNFAWINDPMFRNDIKVKLDTIKNNFRPHASCWIKYNDFTTSNTSWLEFPYDGVMLNVNSYTNFPGEFQRLVIGFKYWNIINYFYPYNYVIDTPVDSILYNKMLLIANAANGHDLHYAIERITKDLDDVHAEDYTYNSNTWAPSYFNLPPIRITHTQNKYIVVKSAVAGINRGDEIISINGVSPTVMEDSLRPYVSAGDSGVFYRLMSYYILNGNINTPVSLGYTDSLGVNHIVSANRTSNLSSNFYQSYYPNDTLGNTKWKKIGCNTGYVNMGKLTVADVNGMYNNLLNTSAIIFDLRNYPKLTAWPIANRMFASKIPIAKLLTPDLNYPGTYYWNYDSLGINGNATPYQGKVIIVVNEETQSQAEYTSMILRAMPNAVVVGSQTAGADGDVSYLYTTADMLTSFSSIGIFYPNGDSTQRIGIVPDSVIYQTQLGIRHHRDEVLEKALDVANCSITTIVKNENINPGAITIYPNPARSLITVQSTIEGAMKIDYEVVDVVGKTVIQNQNYNNGFTVNVSDLTTGIYFIRLKINNSLVVKKFVKE